MERARRSPRSRRGARGPRGVGLVVGVAGVSLLGTACAEPDPIQPEPEAGVVEDPIEEPDERDALLDELDGLHTTLRRIEDALAEVRDADSVETAHVAAEQALTHLIVDGEVQGPADGTSNDTPTEDDTYPLLPSETVERTQNVSAPDLLSATLAQAQDTGGQLGRDVADVLRDPIAGDLGAWQRDAAGMVALADQVATASPDLESLERSILELEGEGTRALAWTFAARASDDLESAQTAAERALAHVRVMRVAVEDLGGSS